MIGKVLMISFILGLIILGVLIFADKGEENEREEK